MPRLLLPAVLLLLLGLPALAGEAPRDIDPVEVGRLLLSHDAERRAEGEALLLERIGQGGDLAGFLHAMAEAQVRWADDEERLLERWVHLAVHGDAREREEAGLILETLGPKGRVRLEAARKAERDTMAAEATPAAPSAAIPAPQAAIPTPPETPRAEGALEKELPTLGEAKEPGVETPLRGAEPLPMVFLNVRVDEVAAAEVLRWMEARSAQWAAALRRLEAGRVVVQEGEGAVSLLGSVTALPGARTRGLATLGLSHDPQQVLQGRKVTYRRGVRRTKKGAWAVDTDGVLEGLRVGISLGASPQQVVVEARHTTVPTPLPVTRVRPAPDVDPVEIDEPEWQTATARAIVGLAGDHAAVLIPALMPDRVIVVGLEPVDPEMATARSAPEERR